MSPKNDDNDNSKGNFGQWVPDDNMYDTNTKNISKDTNYGKNFGK